MSKNNRSSESELELAVLVPKNRGIKKDWTRMKKILQFSADTESSR